MNSGFSFSHSRSQHPRWTQVAQSAASLIGVQPTYEISHQMWPIFWAIRRPPRFCICDTSLQETEGYNENSLRGLKKAFELHFFRELGGPYITHAPPGLVSLRRARSTRWTAFSSLMPVCPDQSLREVCVRG